MTPAPIPEDDLATVLHMAEQLYQQDQAHAQQRQEYDAFRSAAAEMGLGDQYLQRATAALQAERAAAFRRVLERRRRLRLTAQVAGGVAVLVILFWVGGLLTSQLARLRRLSPHPPPRPASTVRTAPPPSVPPVSGQAPEGMDLFKAVNAHDNVSVRRLLSEGVDPNSTTASFTPLIAAADHGYADTALLLLDKGAGPNVRDLSRETPLGYASRYGYGDVVSLLLKRGADPNAKNNRGWTPLHYLCIRGDTDLLPVLLDAGADINAQDEHGETPLMYAVADNHFASVQLLLQRHADPNIRSLGGFTALSTAQAVAAKRPGEADDLVRVLQAAGATR